MAWLNGPNVGTAKGCFFCFSSKRVFRSGRAPHFDARDDVLQIQVLGSENPRKVKMITTGPKLTGLGFPRFLLKLPTSFLDPGTRPLRDKTAEAETRKEESRN